MKYKVYVNWNETKIVIDLLNLRKNGCSLLIYDGFGPHKIVMSIQTEFDDKTTILYNMKHSYNQR